MPAAAEADRWQHRTVPGTIAAGALPETTHAPAPPLHPAADPHAGSNLVVVDVVTNRRANFHAEILRLLELNGPAAWESPRDLYAVAYRAAAAERGRQLQAWPAALAVGDPLPRLPLWLGVDIS